ncbi:hypothetical protein EDD15DRAFT_2366234 [Pisolithus albus]|nr:hypothetical protein EDD15DRAFT_2366234 [Pisolithus albus]
MELPGEAMLCSWLLLKGYRTFFNGAGQLPDLDKLRVRRPTIKFHLCLFLPPSVEMSSPRNQTEHGHEGGVDSVVLADLIDFLSGLSFNASTADAAISEIRARARPSLFGTPPPSPVTFPVSPHSTRDSSSPRAQAIYPSIHTPAPSPLVTFKAIHVDRERPATSARDLPPSPSPLTTFKAIHVDREQSATSVRDLPAARATSVKVHAKATAVPGKPASSTSSSSRSTSSAFTTAFGNDNISSSGFTRFEIVPESLKSLPPIGRTGLPVFIIETAKGERRWQQCHKGTYFDVPGPDVGGPYYLVTKGARIGVLATW